MSRFAAALFAATIAGAPIAASAQTSIDGTIIGTPVEHLATLLGTPADVISADSGHRFTFSDGTTVYVDDDAIILAVDTPAGSLRIDVDGIFQNFAVGVYTVDRAEADLANVAEFSTPAFRSYRLAPRRDVVLFFAPSSGRLQRIMYGEPGQLARLGYLPGDAATKAIVYRAPTLRAAMVKPAGAPASRSRPMPTVYRLGIDRSGAVGRLDIVVASPSPVQDELRAQHLRGERFVPATLGGRPIAATVFTQVRD